MPSAQSAAFHWMKLDGNCQVALSTVGLIVVLSTSTCALSAEFWVAPNGDDAGKGTRQEPFATLPRARDAARALPPGQERRIVLREGKYFNTHITLAPQDSGLIIVAAPGEQPILCGGQAITGWNREGSHFCAAALPDYPKLPAGGLGRWEIRSLQVNGTWRPRARFPAQGELLHETVFNVRWMSTTGGGWERKPTREELTTLIYREGDLPTDLEIGNVEITVFHKWDESCVGIAQNDVANRILRLRPAPGHPPGAFNVKRYVIWNTREGLQTPGQWRHDRVTQRLIYYPLPGEDISKLEVIVPAVTTIIRLQGAEREKVKAITLRGLTLTGTTVPLISGGFAARNLDGAVSLSNTEDCSLDRLTIRCVGGHGVKAGGMQSGARVVNCEVTQCGAGGVYVEGTGAVISNNYISSVGRSYPSAVALQGGGTGVVVSHNEIHDCPYSAICYSASESVFEGNLIYDCMKVLGDGAAIYLSGATGSVLRGNVARDFRDVTPGHGASAYYLDERCTKCVVEKNLALRVAHPTHNHMATNNAIRNNVFVVPENTRLTFPRCDGFTFERNIVMAEGRIRVEGVQAITNWHKNVLFSRTGSIELVELDRYRAIGTTTHLPDGVLLADPRLRDPQNANVAFERDSPALTLGIVPIDVTTAGRKPPKR